MHNKWDRALVLTLRGVISNVVHPNPRIRSRTRARNCAKLCFRMTPGGKTQHSRSSFVATKKDLYAIRRYPARDFLCLAQK